MKKKLPAPSIFVTTDDPGVIRFEWDFVSFEMYDDEALRMARDIHDILEGRDHDTTN